MPSFWSLRRGFTNPSSSREVCAMAKAREPVQQGMERASSLLWHPECGSHADSPARGSSRSCADSPARGSRARAQPCTPTLCPALQPHPARVCCRGSGLVTANESKTLTPGKAHVRSHRVPAENGKKHLFREGSVLISSWTVNVTNETFTVLLSFLFIFSFTPTSA